MYDILAKCPGQFIVVIRVYFRAYQDFGLTSNILYCNTNIWGLMKAKNTMNTSLRH